MISIAQLRPLLKNHNFLRLASGHFLTQTSVNMLQFTVLISIFEQTGSSFLTGTFVAALSLPAVFLSYFSGVVADSFDRRRILIAATLGRLTVVLGMYFFVDLPGLLLVLAVLISVGNLFHMPAEAASLGDIVKKEKDLFLANSVIAFFFYTSFLTGYAVAGPLFAARGAETVLLVVFAMYFAAFFLQSGLPTLDAHLGKGRARVRFRWSDVLSRMREGFGFILGHQTIRFAVLLAAFIFSVERGVIALIPAIARELWGLSISEISFVIILPIALGTVVGSVVANKLKRRWSRVRMVLTGFVVDGLVLVAAPFVAQVYALGFGGVEYEVFVRVFVGSIVFLSGFADVMIIVATQTLIHEETDTKKRGRVFGGLQTLLNIVGLPVVLGVSAVAGLSLEVLLVQVGILTLIVFGMAVVYFRRFLLVNK